MTQLLWLPSEAGPRHLKIIDNLGRLLRLALTVQPHETVFDVLSAALCALDGDTHFLTQLDCVSG